MGNQRNKLAVALLGITLLTSPSLFAANGLEPLQESKAYQNYKKRPPSNFSKLIYLIDRFGQAKIEIIYSGQSYAAPFAARLARWFLVNKYRKETPEQWIDQWCTKSILDGSPIWVKMPDETRLESKQVLLDELKALDEAIDQEKLVAASHAAALALSYPDAIRAEARTAPPARAVEAAAR